MTDRPALGRPWQRIVNQTIREEPNCQLKLPGCTGKSQTANHKIPRSKGGPDTRANTEGACHHCNRQLSNNDHPITDTDRHSRQWT